MRNPWPVSIATIIAIGGFITILQVFPNIGVIIPFIIVFALVILYFAFLTRYPLWIGKKVDVAVEKYQNDHDEVQLNAVLQALKSKSFSKDTKTMISVQLMDVFLERNNINLLESELKHFKKSAKTKEELSAYHMFASEYDKRIQNKEDADKHLALYNYYSYTTDSRRKSYTAKQCKQYFINWMSYTVVIVIIALISVIILPSSLDFISIFLFLIVVVSIPFSILWLVYWIKTTANLKEVI